MTTSPDVTGKEQPRDAAYWARQIPRLKVSSAPSGALNLNVEGREAMSPLQGFGQLWQKTFRIRLDGAYQTHHIKRFGSYVIDLERLPPPLEEDFSL